MNTIYLKKTTKGNRLKIIIIICLLVLITNIISLEYVLPKIEQVSNNTPLVRTLNSHPGYDFPFISTVSAGFVGFLP